MSHRSCPAGARLFGFGRTSEKLPCFSAVITFCNVSECGCRVYNRHRSNKLSVVFGIALVLKLNYSGEMAFFGRSSENVRYNLNVYVELIVNRNGFFNSVFAKNALAVCDVQIVALGRSHNVVVYKVGHRAKRCAVRVSDDNYFVFCKFDNKFVFFAAGHYLCKGVL